MSSPARRWWALGVIAMTQLVVVLDATIVNVALPQAQVELGMSGGERQWVVTAYVLAFGALLLLGGRVADFWGRRRSYVVGMVGFGVASVWGGLAQSGTELIAARGVQGLFAALLAPAALSLLTITFPSGRERGTAFAVFGTVAGAGAAVGLALGGVLTEFAGWRWCLLVNIIFTVLGVVGARLFLDESRAEGRHKLDVLGAVLITVGLASLVYGFTRAEEGWGAASTVAFLAIGVALLAAFVWVESRRDQPLLPLRVVLDRTRGAAFLIQGVVGAIFIGTMLFMAFHLQILLGLSPLWAGIGSLAMTFATTFTAPVAAKLFARLGGRVVMTVGPVISATGMLYLSRLSQDGTYWSDVLPGLVLVGLGLAFVVIPVQNVALTGVEPRDAGAAAALVNSSMQIGGSIALALFTTLFVTSAGGDGGAGAISSATSVEAYAAVYVASAVVLLFAAVAAVTMIRGARPDDAANAPADVAVRVH